MRSGLYILFFIFLFKEEFASTPDGQKRRYQKTDIEPGLLRPVNNRLYVPMKKSDQDGAPPACLGYGQGEGEPKNMNSRYHVIFLELLYFLMHKVQGVSVHSDQCDKGNFDHHKIGRATCREGEWSV